MKKIIIVSLALIVAVGLSVLPTMSKANGLKSKLSGQVLLAVQSHGEAWYVNPIGGRPYFLGDSLDAFNLMRQFGLGISNKDFSSFNDKAPVRLSGRILLKVEDLGRAYYVNPANLKLVYLGNPQEALGRLQDFGLGISNNDLIRLAILENVDVSITDSGFSPKTLTVNKGTIITWKNYTKGNQTVTSPNNFDFGEIAADKTYSRTFNIVGTYNYYSSNDKDMTGSIIVK